MSESSSADSGPARLATHAGVRPSRGWLQSCRSHLIEQGETGGDDDAILHQIFHTDLRDVVRWTNGDSESTAEAAPLTLRRAIRQSLPSTNDPPCKSTLPEGFTLLVQVEECLDLSLNAESRAALGPASATAPTPVGDQRKRCLKMFLSDGYYDGGSPDPNQAQSEEKRHLLVAMETSPLPDISVHSQPGIKLLLRGPITVRLGMIMLNEGNATVMGGVVPALVPVQKKAREAARRLAGVGVDPTIKALIWNPNTGAEEEEDEGEEASGDVQAPVVTQTQQTGTSNATAPDNAAQRTGPQRFISQSSAGSANRVEEAARRRGRIASSSNRMQNQQQSVSRNNNSASASSNRRHSQQQHQRQQTLHGVQPGSAASRPPEGDVEMADTTSSVRSPSRNRAGNPYANRNPYTSSSATTQKRPQQNASHSGTSRLQAPLVEEKSSVEGANASSTSTLPHSSPDHRKTPQAPLETPREAASLDSAPSSERSNSAFGSGRKSSQDSVASGLQSMSATDGAGIGTRGLALSPTALSEPMSFAELQELLKKAIAQPSLYSSYEGRTFIVPSKLKEIVHFNIAKVKGKRKKSKGSSKKAEKQYEFVMRCQFIGPEGDGIITCRIASSLLEPFFSVSPYELRKMHKENKEQGSKLVNEKGQEILQELNSLASFHLKLLSSHDEFFKQEKVPKDVDGGDAILLVCGRDDL